MYWLMLLLAGVAFVLALQLTQVLAMSLCLLLSLLLLLIACTGLHARRQQRAMATSTGNTTSLPQHTATEQP